MEVTKPYEFIEFGAMDATKPYEFIGFWAMDVTKPYEYKAKESTPKRQAERSEGPIDKP